MKRFIVISIGVFILIVISVGIHTKIKDMKLLSKEASEQNVCSDIEFIKSKFPNIKEIESVSYIYNKESGDREVGLEKIHFEGIINIGKSFSKKIEKEYNWEQSDEPPNLSIKTQDADYMYSDEFEDMYISDSFVGTFYFLPDYNKLIFCGEY